MTEQLVQYSVQDGVAVLTLADPPANAYTHEMLLALDSCILKARFDDSVHVILLTGAGEKFFCAGANIQMLQGVDPSFKYYFCMHANETLNRLESTPKLVIAALNGHTVGGGLEIALACDLRIAKAGASKCGIPEVALGVLPGTGGTQRLVRLLGRQKALKLMIDGKNSSFDEALSLGLIDEILPEENFMEAVLKLARGYLPPTKASKAVGMIKRACVSGAEMSFHDGLALERELQQQLFQSKDATEGITAFNEKRSPHFGGS